MNAQRSVDAAWGRLQALAATTPSLSELFAKPRLAERFCAKACGLYMDYSKQVLDDTRLLALLDLAYAKDLPAKIADLLSGKKINTTENRAALHTALRLPKGEALIVDGEDVGAWVHAGLDKCERISERVRSGVWRGYSGKAITDVVNIGVGGSDLGPLMATTALQEWADTDIRVHFVSNMDGTQLENLLKKLNAQTTLFILSSKSFATVDTLVNAKTAKAWLLATGAKESSVLRRHFIGVSTRPDKMSQWGIHPDNQLLLWDWVGGRFSMWSSIGLAIAIFLGMAAFRDLLFGAYQMDRHFACAPLDRNLPALLGLIGVWNATFLGIHTHTVLPYDGRLSFFPNYLTQLEMESNGKSVAYDGAAVDYDTCPILWGGVGSNAQHAFYQLLHQGTRRVSCDFIAPVRRYDNRQSRHDAYLEEQHQWSLANCLAQSRVLAFGNGALPSGDVSAFKRYRGNQPSTTLLLDSLSPRSLGALIALYEHKVYTMSVIWEINPFDQWGVEVGKVIANAVFGALTGKSEIAFDASTDALLCQIAKKGEEP